MPLATVDLRDQPPSVVEPPTQVTAPEEASGVVEQLDLEVVGRDAGIEAVETRVRLEGGLGAAIGQVPPVVGARDAAPSACKSVSPVEVRSVDKASVERRVHDGYSGGPGELGNGLSECPGNGCREAPIDGYGFHPCVELPEPDPVAAPAFLTTGDRSLRWDVQWESPDAVECQRATADGDGLVTIGEERHPGGAASMRACAKFAAAWQLIDPSCYAQQHAVAHENGPAAAAHLRLVALGGCDEALLGLSDDSERLWELGDVHGAEASLFPEAAGTAAPRRGNTGGVASMLTHRRGVDHGGAPL